MDGAARARYNARVLGERVTVQAGEPGSPARLDATFGALRLERGPRWSPAMFDAARPAVALVGSRAAPRAVMEQAFALGRDAAAAGWLVVSGGALGVDGAAHRGALAGGGPTAVVLGSGLDRLYPARHVSLFATVVEQGGALLSMFDDGLGPRAATFVSRNRLIAGLADVIVVVGAERGSGSLHTARFAVGLGRRLAAVPGTAGTDALIAAGAACIEDAGELPAIAAGRVRAAARRALCEVEATVVAALDPDTPRPAATVAAATGLAIPLAAGVLVALEHAGWVIAAPAGFRRARA